MGLMFAILVYHIFAAGEYTFYYSCLAPLSVIMSIAAMYGAWASLKYFRTALNDD